MRVAVIGGGNIGTLMAADMAHRGHSVRIYTSKPGIWSQELQVYDGEQNHLFSGRIEQITDDLAQAVESAQLIWVTVPAQAFAELAEKLCPLVKVGQMVGVVPGSGGAEFAFRKIIERGGILFGLQRVHSIARLKAYGQSVMQLGRKPQLHIGAIPAAETSAVCRAVELLLGMPCQELPNYLCVTLTPSNPILHTSRLWSMFHDQSVDRVYPEKLLFYEGWTQESSQMLLACDAELQSLCKAIPMELVDVKSLKEHYESDTPEKMTRKIAGIPAFRGLTAPMIPVRDGWQMDLSSRYFTADFSYGLKILLELCKLFGVEASNMEIVWDWYTEIASDKNHFELTLSQKEFLDIYQ